MNLDQNVRINDLAPNSFFGLWQLLATDNGNGEGPVRQCVKGARVIRIELRRRIALVRRFQNVAGATVVPKAALIQHHLVTVRLIVESHHLAASIPHFLDHKRTPNNQRESKTLSKKAHAFVRVAGGALLMDTATSRRDHGE